MSKFSSIQRTKNIFILLKETHVSQVHDGTQLRTGEKVYFVLCSAGKQKINTPGSNPQVLTVKRTFSSQEKSQERLC